MNTRLAELVAEVGAKGPQSRRAAARLMTAMTDHPQAMAQLLAASHAWPQPELVLGVTGAPGSGKSTLVDRLTRSYRQRFPERQVGVVAVDPSSPFTGGALLGDRIRMMRHSTDRGVFIRSLATRGRLGGLALGAKGVVRVMGLLGCDLVLVETVGVGQSEIEIAQQADATLVVLAPGQGDSIQLLKAGLIEAGDLFVVNKSDREGADRLRQQLEMALVGRPLKGAEPQPEATPVFLCSAWKNDGIVELVDYLQELAERRGPAFKTCRQAGAVEDIRAALLHEIERRVDRCFAQNGAKANVLEPVLKGTATIEETADKLLESLAAELNRSQARELTAQRYLSARINSAALLR